MDPLSLRYTLGEINDKLHAVSNGLVAGSPFVRSPNFTVLSPRDLSRLFGLYDEAFFDGFLRREIASKARGRLSFRLAPRMTRAGGKTFRIGRPDDVRYEIAISTRLLLSNFGDRARPTSVCGVPCATRLDALQRIMEHEMLHLLEFLVWNKSSCTANRFKTMAQSLFAHGASTHDLITPSEQAREKYDVRIGDAVSFTFERRVLTGFVNRVNRRATVLVESPTGVRYTNGKRYEKFYIPLGMLKKNEN